MPFTFSHPAIVLPFGLLPKRFISVTGLVAGSVAPDFEYFLRLKIKSEYSHTIDGMFWYDLPLALILAFVFHAIVRDTLIANSPRWFRKRLDPFKTFDWKNHFRKHIPAVLISLLIGIFSHLLWDAFTHEEGYYVTRIHFLKSSLHLFGNEIAVYHLLQHGCTVLGALFILWVIARLPKTETAAGKINLNYYLLIFSTAALFILAGYFAGKNYLIYGELIITGISGGLFGTILGGLILRKK